MKIRMERTSRRGGPLGIIGAILLSITACAITDTEEPAATPTQAVTATPSEAEQESPDQPGTAGGSDTNADEDQHEPNDADPRDFTSERQAGEIDSAARGTDSLLLDVRHGQHEGYERVVFEFSESPPWSYSAEYVDEAITGMPDVGDTEDRMPDYEVLRVSIDGLEHVDEPAHAPELHHEDAWYPTESDVVGEVMLGMLFEGTGTYFIGLEKQSEFHIAHAENPNRIIIDVATS